jgi:hypothetical protein
MPNWDHRCPKCGENGSYLDFGTCMGDSSSVDAVNDRGRCPWCRHEGDAEEFFDPTYYPPYEDEEDDEEVEV